MREILLHPITKRSGLGAREIIVVASDATLDRVGDIMVADGCDLSSYLRNPIVLANHDASSPIGTFEPTIQNRKLAGKITFAPEGLSSKADEYCGLVKAGILRTVSVGFNPIKWDSLPDGGRRYTEWELLEVSIVAVPANGNAVVVARSATAIGKAGRVLSRENARSLRDAHGLMLNAHALTLEAVDHIKRVIDQAQPDDEEDPDFELHFAGSQKDADRDRRLRMLAIMEMASPNGGEEAARARRLREILVRGLAAPGYDDEAESRRRQLRLRSASIAAEARGSNNRPGMILK